MRSPKVLRSVRDTVTEALLTERQLEIRYRRSNDSEPQVWHIRPLGLVQLGGVFYLAARLFDYRDARTLALQRIERATMLADPVEVPEGFSLDRWLEEGAMDFGDGGRLTCVVLYHAKSHHNCLDRIKRQCDSERPWSHSACPLGSRCRQ